MTSASVHPSEFVDRAGRFVGGGWLQAPVAPEDYDAEVAEPRGLSTLWPKPVATKRRSAESTSALQAIRDVIRSLEDDSFDFRSVSSLSAQTGLHEAAVREVLDILGGAVRTPVKAQGDEFEQYRLTSRGHTRGEWLRWLKHAISRG